MTRSLPATVVVLALMPLAGMASAQAAHDHAAPAAKSAAAAPAVDAKVIGADGKALGTVTLQQTAAGVLVTANVQGLPAGEHGFHFHQKGQCDPATKFESAGGHFAGGPHQHGYLDAKGPHGGDMPNQYVGADGILKTQILNTGVTLGAGPKSLFDADGSALVIHAGADDYTSQPSGNAGGRLACAVIAAAK